MKVNITGMLRGAVRSIDPERDEGAYAFAVEELIGHVEDVRAGRHTLAEFADFYCMAPASQPSPVLLHNGEDRLDGGERG